MEEYEKNKLMITASKLYYEDNKNQEEIGKKLNMSRSLVSKYLNEARKKGIIQIIVNTNYFSPNFKLEEKIKKKYGLDHVICVSSEKNKNKQKQEVARVAGQYLYSQLEKDSIIAISGGTTVNYSIQNMVPTTQYPNVNIVSAVGGVNEKNSDLEPNFICAAAAKKLMGTSTLLFAPVAVDTVEARKILINQSYIKEVLDKVKSADLALLGLGGYPLNINTTGRVYRELLKNEKRLLDNKVIGDFCYQFFDINGNPVDCDWNKRVISIDFDSIRKISNVIIVAEGNHKAKSLKAILKTRLINTIVIDTDLGEKILDN